MNAPRLSERLLPNRLNKNAAIYSDGLTLRYLDIPRPEIESSQARVAEYLHFLKRGTLINRELSKEMSREFLEIEEVPAFTTSMVILKCGSRFGPNPEIPFDILMMLSQAEQLNRETPGATTVCVIGHSLAEIENPGMTPAEREQNSRYAFALLRLLENLRTFFPSIQAVLDTDLMGTNEYKEAKKELRQSHGEGFLIAFEMAVLSLTVQKIFGAAIKLGWSSFADTKEYEAVRRGLAPVQSKVAGCHIAPDMLLRGRIAFIYSLPGIVYSDFSECQYAEPDVVKPQMVHGKIVSKDGEMYFGRVLFNPRLVNLVDELSIDSFDLSLPELRKHITRQKLTHQLLKSLRELNPAQMPSYESLNGDLDMSKRVLDLCKDRANAAAIACEGIPEAERQLELAVRAHAEALSARNREETRFMINEFGVEASAVAPSRSRISVPTPVF